MGTGVLTIPTTAPSGNYQVIYTWGTTGQVCGDSTYTFNVFCVPPDCCSGSSWKDALSVFDATGINLQTLSCNVPGTIININPALNNCDKPLTIKGLFVCNTSNCASKVEYVLSNNTGVVVSGTNSLVIPANLPNGNYILSYIAYCGAKICETCKIEVFKNCPPACDCGKWDKLNITGTTNNYVCGIGGTGIIADCNKLFKFNISYDCAPASASCLADIKWEIKNGAVQVAQGGGASPAFGSFTPTQNGTYILSLTAICNGKVCPVICTYKIVVTNCCEPKIVKVTDGNGNPVTPNQICVTPGSYNAQLDPTAPVVSGTYIATVLPNGAILNSGAFTSTTSQTITVPQYICGQKEKIRIEYKWNNKQCSAVWEKQICPPYNCCQNINFVTSAKTVSGTNINFTTTFSVAAPGTTINKVKVQLLEVSVAGTPRPLANILTLSATGLGTGTVNPAITTSGTAIWFSTPTTITATTLNFSGTLINVGTVAGLTVRVRYTFYQANGSCPEWICEKNVLIQ